MIVSVLHNKHSKSMARLPMVSMFSNLDINRTVVVHHCHPSVISKVMASIRANTRLSNPAAWSTRSKMVRCLATTTLNHPILSKAKQSTLNVSTDPTNLLVDDHC